MGAGISLLIVGIVKIIYDTIFAMELTLTENPITIRNRGEYSVSKKEAGFIKDYILTGNGTEAAVRNYNVKNRNSAAVIASENLRKPKICRIIESFADRIPDDLLLKKHLELLTVPRKVRTTRHGELVMEIEELDTNAVIKGLDMAYKLKGYYKKEPDKQEDDVNPTLESINTLIKMLSTGKDAKLNDVKTFTY